MFKPSFSISNETALGLMDIQRASTIIEILPLPSSVLENLKKESRETTVLLSTKIEGNMLNDKMKKEAMYIEHETEDAQEVYNLMKALDFIESAEEKKLPITEEFIKQLHSIIQVHSGRRPRLSPYRTEQNHVGTREQDNWYLPPEANDVPSLMEELVTWINLPETLQIPTPIKAAIVMHQFLTIHPYYDGNGRTARMLATYILRRGGFGLKGLFVLETYYDRNLRGYYKSLQLGCSHNYYAGRNRADKTIWIDFFVKGLREVFEEAAALVKEESIEYTKIEPALLRELDPHQRIVFAQMTKQNWMSSSDLCKWLGFSDRTLRDKIKIWIEKGFIEKRDPESVRARSYKLTGPYSELIREIEKEPDRYKWILAD